MAHSVEVRLPMLDYRLVELAFSLGDDWKIRGELNKVILRTATQGRIPELVRARVDKMGFPSPNAKLLKDGTFEVLYELVSSRAVRERGVYAWDRMIRDLQTHRGTERMELALRFFRVAQFELWAKLHCL